MELKIKRDIYFMRCAGILMPISSLPNNYGIGTIGKTSYEFIDFLKSSHIKIWQILPLLPTSYGNSPYQACASNALNYYFIDLDLLKEDGLLLSEDYQNVKWSYDDRRVDFYTLFTNRLPLLKKAFSRFNKKSKKWKEFLEKGEYLDFSVFMSLKCDNDYKPFNEWGKYANYNKEIVDEYIKNNKENIEFWQFTQYIFIKQWKKLKTYANKNGVKIMGDMPIYLAEDSVEMWKYSKELFLLNENGKPSLVAGVPPDAFCDDGQLWGNPVYNWAKMEKEDYKWWKDRIFNAFNFYDILRIDHFRGFDRFYTIKNGSENAKMGEWLDGPKFNLFKDIKHLQIVAEDLGVIDDGVIKLMSQTQFPGMKVIMFAFNEDEKNPHKPSNYIENAYAYTGTHDNEPLMEYLEEISGESRKVFLEKLKIECEKLKVKCKIDSNENIVKSIVNLLFASKADNVILPYQDVIMIGKGGRINSPSTLSQDNWTFRFIKKDFNKNHINYIKKLVEKYHR